MVASYTYRGMTDDQIGLQQEQPQLYETLTKDLNPEEQQVVQGAVHQADIIVQQQVELANGHPPTVA